MCEGWKGKLILKVSDERGTRNCNCYSQAGVSSQTSGIKSIRYEVNGKKCQLKLVGTLIVVRLNHVISIKTKSFSI